MHITARYSPASSTSLFWLHYSCGWPRGGAPQTAHLGPRWSPHPIRRIALHIEFGESLGSLGEEFFTAELLREIHFEEILEQNVHEMLTRSTRYSSDQIFGSGPSRTKFRYGPGHRPMKYGWAELTPNRSAHISVLSL